MILLLGQGFVNTIEIKENAISPLVVDGTMQSEALKTMIDALAFAAHKHKDQRRKDADASPYINHPIALVEILVNEGGIDDYKTLCGALLHDTVEDTETTASELETHFGPAIAAIVVEVTDDKTMAKAARKQAQIEHAPHLSERAKVVKLADKIANLRDMAANPPEGWSLTRRREYFDWAKTVIDGLRGCHSQLEETFDRAYEARP